MAKKSNPHRSFYLTVLGVVAFAAIVFLMLKFNVIGEATRSKDLQAPYVGKATIYPTSPTSPQLKLANGYSCTSDSQCGSNWCYNGKCKAKLANGVACSGNIQCASNLCVNGVCRVAALLLADGYSCTSNYQCGSNLCYNGKCKAKFVNGAACTSNVQCVSTVCSNGFCYNCLDDSTCLGSLGNSCSISYTGTYNQYSFQCLSVEFCSRAESQCNGGYCYYYSCKIPSGSSCTSNSQCASRLCSNGVCKLENSLPCSSNSQCASGICNQLYGSCGPLVFGSSCTGSYQCNATSVCSNSICKLGPDSACTSHSQCSSGNCQNGFCAIPSEPSVSY